MRNWIVNGMLLGSLLLSMYSNAQAVVGFPNQDRIYAGFSNYFECGTTTGDTLLTMTATNATVTKSGNGFIIKPSGNKEVVVSILNSNKEVLASKTYRVFALPNPELYLGNTKNGNKLDYRLSSELKVQMDPYTTLGSIVFTINSWEVSLSGSGKVYRGTGSSLTDEVVEQIRIAPDNTELSIICNYAQMNEPVTKKITAKFKL
jgi:hypothetical protein